VAKRKSPSRKELGCRTLNTSMELRKRETNKESLRREREMIMKMATSTAATVTTMMTSI
jgi:hypothetical protein